MINNIIKREGGLRTKGLYKTDSPDKPLVTVVTIVRNGENYLEETLKSVVNQTYGNIEYIVIDGRSTDRSVDIIKKYEDHIDYWISEPDKGVYDAMNKGIKKSSGKYLNFMNAGDRFFDEKVVEDFADIFREEYLIVVGDTVVEYPDTFRMLTKARLTLYNMPTSHHSMFFHKDVFKIFGLYKRKYKIVNDMDLWQRVYLKAKDKILLKGRVASLTDLSGETFQKRLLMATQKIILIYNNLRGWNLISGLISSYLNFARCLIIYLLERIGIYSRITRWRYKSRRV